MKIRSTSEVRRKPCPYCGRAMLFDDPARTIHHEAPTCDGFMAAMAKCTMKPTRVEPCAWVDDMGATDKSTN